MASKNICRRFNYEHIYVPKVDFFIKDFNCFLFLEIFYHAFIIYI